MGQLQLVTLQQQLEGQQLEAQQLEDIRQALADERHAHQQLEQQWVTLKGEYEQQSELNARLEQTIEGLVARGIAEQQAYAELQQQLDRVKSGPTILTLRSSDLFDTGSTQLSQQGRVIMARVAKLIADYPDHRVRVIGHTDSYPLGEGLKQRFSSNWELSAARASAAVLHLQYSGQIAPERMELVGRGHYQPLASDATAAGRKSNRRLEIQLIPPEVRLQQQRLAIP